jgi:hypothetical protein
VPLHEGSVLGTKIEIRLKKSEQIQWSDINAAARKAAAAVQPANFSNPEMPRPTYPSSKAAQMKKATVELALFTHVILQSKRIQLTTANMVSM